MRGLLWLLLALLCGDALASPRIGLVTMAPGSEYWSRFGHNALLVDDGGTRTAYNYGFFDFEQPDFLLRFAQGRMRYRLVALPFERDLESYRQEGRGVRLQWLDLTPAQAQSLADFLVWNARPENAEYDYDYFRDNCATRVRDALDRALDGRLRPQLDGRSRGLSYRMEALRLGMEPLWMGLGMHAGLGREADVPLSRWDESFVPMRLAEAVREARTSDGRPLVLAERELLPHRLAPEADDPPRWGWRYFGVGVALAALLLAGPWPRGRALLAGVVWLACGVGGVAIALLWFASAHGMAAHNANLLLFNPLCLLLLPAVPALWRDRPAGRTLRALAWGVFVLAAGWCLLWLIQLQGQDQADWLALMLPVHGALALRLQRGARGPQTA